MTQKVQAHDIKITKILPTEAHSAVNRSKL